MSDGRHSLDLSAVVIMLGLNVADEHEIRTPDGIDIATVFQHLPEVCSYERWMWRAFSIVEHDHVPDARMLQHRHSPPLQLSKSLATD